MKLSESSHLHTYISLLEEDIRELTTDNENGTLSLPAAAARVSLSRLGYDSADLIFIDSKDRGIDAWVTSSSSGFKIFQVKTHETKPGDVLDLSSFDGTGVQDLSRAKDFFFAEKATNVSKRALQQLLLQRDSALRNYKLEGNSVEVPLILHLVILGNNLTEQALAEFKAFQNSISRPIELDGVPFQVRAVLHTVNDIINRRWREENRKWIDSEGQPCEKIHFHPEKESALIDNANAIFYCRAIDLVNAYEKLGYQLFEPNVRANITNSPVNRDIRQSVQHRQSRHEFKFLNNGVIICCETFTKPNQNKAYFTVVQPGVVNGLQTVVALHTAYGLLSQEEKEDFEKHCSVMVRLLAKTAVKDITQVVKTTNNQNPMKPRNLVSNNPEQLIYIRLFADQLGWFYEAKQGAWDAFDNDPRRWRPSLNKRPKDFKSGRRIKKIDNEKLAQTWFAFIGFAEEAVNDKKSLFDEKFYPLIFKQRTRKHGLDYDFLLARAKEDVIEQSPHATLMLATQLAYSFVDEVTLTTSQNRQDACQRLGLDFGKMPRADLDAKLNRDNDFILNQVLRGTGLLFVEFLGFVLYQALGENLHTYGTRILNNHSFKLLEQQFDIETVKSQLNNGAYDPHDLLPILWLVFVKTIDDMVNMGWGDSYRVATAKIRFIYSRETRESFFKQIQKLDEFMQRRSIKEPWAIGVEEKQGLFSFVKSCLE